MTDLVESIILEVVLRMHPHSSGIVVTLPGTSRPEFPDSHRVEVHGHRVELYGGAEVEDDRMLIEWDEPGIPHRRVRLHIPADDTLGPHERQTYGYVRAGGGTLEAARRAVEASRELPVERQETMVRLLEDGTPWERAVGLARTL